ncbi:MAG: RluA family pseudouridine synthase [Deltaproteobacteria bacterium]|nr:RluA family pseudouridine synthase [Deltaproteobacteria bacterium]
MPEVVHIVEVAGDRLDHYLAQLGLCTSRSESLQLIRDSFVLVNGAAVKPSCKVRVGDKITVNRPPIKSMDLVPRPMNLNVLFEDRDIIVLNKQAGIAVHPGAGNYNESLVHGLLYHCRDLSGIGGVERPGIVHRLDKGTSGVLVVAKNDQAHQNLSDQFKNKTVQKIYHALCLGEVQKTQQTLVHLMKRSEQNRKRFVVNQKKGKEAITGVRVIQKNKRVTYVEVQPKTGRTHQIRVHLSYIGHPILGDEVYGGTKKLHLFDEAEQKFIRGLGRPLLHAKQLTLKHPASGKEMTFEAEMPLDFNEALRMFY